MKCIVIPGFSQQPSVSLSLSCFDCRNNQVGLIISKARRSMVGRWYVGPAGVSLDCKSHFPLRPLWPFQPWPMHCSYPTVLTVANCRTSVSTDNTSTKPAAQLGPIILKQNCKGRMHFLGAFNHLLMYAMRMHHPLHFKYIEWTWIYMFSFHVKM